jgi:hypothetical protein
MKWLSSLAKSLPPTRVLVAAGVALVSYFVTSVWKAGIDDDLKKYNAIIERLSFIDAQSSTLPTYEMFSRALSENLALQELQVAILSRLAKVNEPNAATAYAAFGKYGSGEYYVVERQTKIFTDFFKKLPGEVKSLTVNDDDQFYLRITLGGNYDSYSISSCIKSVTSFGSLIGVIYSQKFARYGDDLVTFDQQAIEKSSGSTHLSTLTPSTVEQVSQNLEAHGKIASAAGLSLSYAVDRDLKWLSDRLPRVDDSILIDFLNGRADIFQCVGNKNDAILAALVYFSYVIRNAVDENFVVPGTATKHFIERLEIAVYVLTVLVALFGGKKAASDSDDIT